MFVKSFLAVLLDASYTTLGP